ncbi:metallophosphoesterase [Massilia sp. S19_KUP03_FR1]|uniref:metallophosphoesterase n=1 Tax=Massilia sp. S19_KUP03_FR1 TaxID=3025503 RepID=UPI002FCD7F65
MFHFVFTLPWLVVVTRFLWPLPWRRSAKVAVALILLLAAQYHLFSRLSSGSVFTAEMPRSLVILFNWGFGAILLLALMQIVLDLATVLARLVRARRRVIAPGLRYAMAGAALVLAAIGVHQAIRVPPLKDVEVRIHNLPPAFDGYTLLQLTDLHISPLFPAPWTRALVEGANAANADLVVITGDLIDGGVAERTLDVAALRGLRAPDGVFVIPGNHEYFFDEPAWMRHFAGLGMRPLENRHSVIERRGAQLVLAGVTDLSASRAGYPQPNLAQALAGAPRGAPVILLDHQPRNARAAAAQGVALQLSGHTHGGLIVGLDRIFALANAGFVSGLYDVQGMQLYVNNGTALWGGLALRLGKPSELTRIILRRAPG